jgi:glycosyltransferase involved in cell wall biosynthesis
MTSQVAEILLVDNASPDDRTREVTEEFPSVRYIWEPRRGLDWARNRALAEARTAVVAFTDDDALVHPGWVDGLLRAFRDEPEAVIVTGLVLPAELATPAQILFEGRGGFGRGLERKWFSRGLRSGSLEPAFDVVTGSAGAGANMAVRRQRLCDLGGFDLALDVGTPSGGGGDLEALFRVVAAGDLVVYEPSAVVRHRHRASMADLTRQRRGDGTGTYSIFLGAGSRCGPAIRRRFLGLALWWLAKRHLRRAICSVLWPELWPPSLVAAEIRGVLDATFGRYYARGLEQARQDALRHSTEVPVPGIAALSPCRQR